MHQSINTGIAIAAQKILYILFRQMYWQRLHMLYHIGVRRKYSLYIFYWHLIIIIGPHVDNLPPNNSTTDFFGPIRGGYTVSELCATSAQSSASHLPCFQKDTAAKKDGAGQLCRQVSLVRYTVYYHDVH